jgi:mono/diheme cytochrome c family protein
MFRKLFLFATAATIAATLFAASSGNADQSKGTAITIPTPRTAPISGKQMYASYCAPCHGVNGKGDGHVGTSLTTRPLDRTLLSKNNQGKCPSAHSISILQQGARLTSHGTAEMPVWGPVLGKMNQANPQERPLRISNLASYLETIQAK